MKTIILTIIFLKICLTAYGGELTITSPDKRYSIIFRHSKGESFLPDIYLQESLTGHDISKLAEYARIKKGTSSFNALWSPDSHYVAVSLTGLHGFAKVHDPDQALIYVGDNPVRVWRIEGSRISLLEFLPIPKAIDTKKTSFLGGTSAHSWEGNKILWISDDSKNRCFRYRLTKDGKMLADGFKDIPKKTAGQNADGATPETPQSPR